MTTTLKRLSVCECGFPALRDEIQLGAQYEIRPEDRASVMWTCGGCGQFRQLEAVYVEPRNGSQGGYLPAEIFEASN